MCIRDRLESVFGIDAEELVPISAKVGTNVDAVLRAVVERVPAPGGDASPDAKLRALLLDCHYDSYRGAVASVSAQASKAFTVSLPRRSRTVPYPNALRSACVRDSLPSVPACLECFFVDPRAMVERARSSEANEARGRQDGERWASGGRFTHFTHDASSKLSLIHI